MAAETVAYGGFLYDCGTYILADLFATIIVGGAVWFWNRRQIRKVDGQLHHALQPSGQSFSRDRQMGVPIKNQTGEDITVRAVALEVRSNKKHGLRTMGLHYRPATRDEGRGLHFSGGTLSDQARWERSFHLIPAECEGTWWIPMEQLQTIEPGSKLTCKIVVEYKTVLGFNRIVSVYASDQWIHDFEQAIRDVIPVFTGLKSPSS
jgi:hypothetical protein